MPGHPRRCRSPSIPGNTAGYTDDYDEVCPYTGSTSADVVYTYTATETESVDIDMCGSHFDTKIYVYDAALNLVACNDDAYFGPPCGMYISALVNVPLAAGETYYLVIDGYFGDFGEYLLEIRGYEPCVLECPPAGFPEGDAYGNLTFCGVSGLYFSAGGANYRDTDWFILTIGPGGVVDVTMDAEYPTYFMEICPPSCSSSDVYRCAA